MDCPKTMGPVGQTVGQNHFMAVPGNAHVGITVHDISGYSGGIRRSFQTCGMLMLYLCWVCVNLIPIKSE